MNWRQFADYIVGNKETFTQKEVRDIVFKTMHYVTDCWINQKR